MQGAAWRVQDHPGSFRSGPPQQGGGRPGPPANVAVAPLAANAASFTPRARPDTGRVCPARRGRGRTPVFLHEEHPVSCFSAPCSLASQRPVRAVLTPREGSGARLLAGAPRTQEMGLGANDRERGHDPTLHALLGSEGTKLPSPASPCPPDRRAAEAPGAHGAGAARESGPGCEGGCALTCLHRSPLRATPEADERLRGLSQTSPGREPPAGFPPPRPAPTPAAAQLLEVTVPSSARAAALPASPRALETGEDPAASQPGLLLTWLGPGSPRGEPGPSKEPARVRSQCQRSRLQRACLRRLRSEQRGPCSLGLPAVICPRGETDPAGPPPQGSPRPFLQSRKVLPWAPTLRAGPGGPLRPRPRPPGAEDRLLAGSGMLST